MGGIPLYKDLSLLRVTFQGDSKFMIVPNLTPFVVNIPSL